MDLFVNHTLEPNFTDILVTDYNQQCAFADAFTTNCFMNVIQIADVLKLMSVLRAHSLEAYNHSLRVFAYTVIIGKYLLRTHDIRIVALGAGALLHDIGKVWIPQDILNKPCRLLKEEYEVIKEHPRYGALILNETHIEPFVMKMVYEHHERDDGLGYPLQKKGDEIMLESKLIAIADSFDAITAKRCYSNSEMSAKAIYELRGIFKSTEELLHVLGRTMQ